jgi:L-erythro-3,5-diaminohexanoate dehydrogenase
MGAIEERKNQGHPLGIHRVLDEKSCLPQAAKKLDNQLPIFSNEILIQIERLNIDAASFVQMEQETGKNPEAIGKIVLENCRANGKQQNRVTGSGGMLIGQVTAIGSHYKGPLKTKVGDRVATLVSLTLTPLHISKIKKVHMSTHQIEVEGHAILFEKSIAAALPKDIPETAAMAAFDVAGAPAYVYALCRSKEKVVVIGGGGKAGLLSCVAARKKVGKSGVVIAIEPFAKAAEELKSLGVCNEVISVDATDPISVQTAVDKATHGKKAGVVVNVASVPDTENSALLSVKDKGKVLFFSMATSFTKVALGAEGIASSAQLYFGNGYYPKHAEFTVGLLRSNKKLKSLFIKRYAQP